MEASVTCSECGATTEAEVASEGHSEYVACGDCGHRFLWEPAGGGGTASEELDWGDGAAAGDYVALYPSTSRPQVAGLMLLLAGRLAEFRVILCDGGEAVVRVPHTAVAAAREALNGDLGDGIAGETLATSGTLKGLQRRLAKRK